MSDINEVLAELDRLHQEATPGEWVVKNVPSGGFGVHSKATGQFICPMAWWQFDSEFMNDKISEANAKFIATVRSAYQDVREHIARLARELAAAQSALRQLIDAKRERGEAMTPEETKCLQALNFLRLELPEAVAVDVEKIVRDALAAVKTEAERRGCLRGLEAQPAQSGKCPTCDSPDPARHPAMQFEGEVQECRDEFHKRGEP